MGRLSLARCCAQSCAASTVLPQVDWICFNVTIQTLLKPVRRLKVFVSALVVQLRKMLVLTHEVHDSLRRKVRVKMGKLFAHHTHRVQRERNASHSGMSRYSLIETAGLICFGKILQQLLQLPLRDIRQRNPHLRLELVALGRLDVTRVSTDNVTPSFPEKAFRVQIDIRVVGLPRNNDTRHAFVPDEAPAFRLPPSQVQAIRQIVNLGLAVVLEVDVCPAVKSNVVPAKGRHVQSGLSEEVLIPHCHDLHTIGVVESSSLR